MNNHGVPVNVPCTAHKGLTQHLASRSGYRFLSILPYYMHVLGTLMLFAANMRMP